MSVTINEMHTDVVADGAGAPGPTQTRTPEAKQPIEQWRELQDRVERDHRRTCAIDFED